MEISIAVLAWNEQEAIGATLQSLFQQSLFERLRKENLRCEIFCVVNGCTDQTPVIAQETFDMVSEHHPHRETFDCRVANLLERGKPNAWNVFVHELSSSAAKILFVMDADIWISRPDTLWNMYQALKQHPDANVAVDQPVKDIAVRGRKSVLDRVSLATSRMNQADDGQLTGQLYCIRGDIARQIYLPRDIIVEDGFIKTLVCTDFLTKPSNPKRIIRAKDAEHIFEAYRSLGSILRNQKRQMIGQTTLHLLLDKELRRGAGGTDRLAEGLRERERTDPAWLKKLTAAHLHETRRFWKLFPGIPGFRFKRLAKMDGVKRMVYLPAALVGVVVTLASCWMAHRFLRRGHTQYWPDTASPGLKKLFSRNGNSSHSSKTLALRK